ncbi:DNA-3-methyladenine glycosylase I [Candidatus Pacearchaeota archaeon]|nr:DNA-3-methyladenine glycosylase I [Candidatus Pacearchaeota archaeon]
MTKKIFEFIVLDLFQAGLNWETILKKRKGFKKAFSNFDPKKISKYSDKKIKN